MTNILWIYEICSTFQNIFSFFFFYPSLSIFYLLTIIVLNDNIFTLYDNINFTERSRNHYGSFDYGKLIKIDVLYYSCQVYTCMYIPISIVVIKWYSIYCWKIVNTQKPFIKNKLNFTLFASLNFLTGN